GFRDQGTKVRIFRQAPGEIDDRRGVAGDAEAGTAVPPFEAEQFHDGSPEHAAMAEAIAFCRPGPGGSNRPEFILLAAAGKPLELRVSEAREHDLDRIARQEGIEARMQQGAVIANEASEPQ